MEVSTLPYIMDVDSNHSRSQDRTRTCITASDWYCSSECSHFCLLPITPPDYIKLLCPQSFNCANLRFRECSRSYEMLTPPSIPCTSGDLLLNTHDKLESLNDFIYAHSCRADIKLGNVSIFVYHTKVNTISFSFGHF